MRGAFASNVERVILGGVNNPLRNSDLLPFQGIASTWYALIFKSDPAAVQALLPGPLEYHDDICELWWANHRQTSVGPYGEAGVTLSARYGDRAGGYYPYMWVTSDVAMAGGREVQGFPKAMGYIKTFDHAPRFSLVLERRDHVVASVAGQFSGQAVPQLPAWYGKPDWGRFNMKITTTADGLETRWDLTFLPPLFRGQPRFRLHRDTWRTAGPDDFRLFVQDTPFDNFGGALPVREVIGLVAFDFDIVIPWAEVLWTHTVKRTQPIARDVPYEIGMYSAFQRPVGG